MLETLTPIPLGNDSIDGRGAAREACSDEQALATSRTLVVLVATLILSGALLGLWSRLPL